MPSFLMSLAYLLLEQGDGDGEETGPELPPGTPPTFKFEGPWFTTQLTLATTIGLLSFLLFSYFRTKWPLLFAPRTKLKGFSPHEAHSHQALFGWILPTIRTSELAVLQIVGLDAAVLLNFFKMSFYLFSVFSVLAALVIMPVNFSQNIDLGDRPDDDSDWPTFAPDDPQPQPQPSTGRDWLDLISDANSYLTLHLVFTYLFTFLALRFIHNNYKRFIRARQLFSLELVHSIPARTVMVTNLPNHLQGERTLAVYFENMDMRVESVSLCREVGSLKDLLDKRTKVLLELEKAWVKYVGNPSTVEAYDPSDNVVQPLVDVDPEAQPTRLVVPHSRRPTLRPELFGPRVDALEYLEKKFKDADDAVQKKRKAGKFKSTHVAFVTFEKMSSAQTAAQVAHAPHSSETITCLAPEPRDIVWANMAYTPSALRAREFIIMGLMGFLLLFWTLPVTALAGLLSYKEIKKVTPWLGDLIDKSETIRAIVQNSLPSVAMISLNALLPFILEVFTYGQGFRARSWIEYSLLKKYFLFLMVNVIFIFLLASTYLQLIRDLANSPAKIPEKLATALLKGEARHFFLSYVILQGLGVMPLQLLNLGVILPSIFSRIFITRTPRDFAELNAPPMINYGVVYPQAILIFVITLLYSVIQPLIVFFGAIYFGVAYVVYKYKLLFVFYKPYESQGQAWPITFTRLIWGVFIFQIFMTGMFLLKKYFVLSVLMAPLLGGTLLWAWYVDRTFKPLSKFVSLSSVCEVERGEDDDVVRLRAGHPVSWSQSNLNHRRYAQNDETLYVAPEDERTDYSQPPMANWYNGVLNTGKRRYGHPALNGVLPQPWLPLKKGQALRNSNRAGARASGGSDQAVVLTLRKRYSIVRKGGKQLASGTRTAIPELLTGNGSSNAIAEAPSIHSDAGTTSDETSSSNPWRNSRPAGPRSQTAPAPLHHRLSFDPASGVITLPDNGDWLVQDLDSDSEEEDYGSPSGGPSPAEPVLESPSTEEAPISAVAGSSQTPSRQRHGTYYHHPEKQKRRTIPGAFPQ